MRIGRKIGSLDEWFSQRSAKPFTAVRIRQEPLSIFMFNSLINRIERLDYIQNI